MIQAGLFAEEVAAAAQIEKELETEDLVLLSQLRRAQTPKARRPGRARRTLPYVADPSLAKPGAAVAIGR